MGERERGAVRRAAGRARGRRDGDPAGGSAASPGKPFAARVYDAVRAIPAGRVATYGDVAAAAGRPGAARAVGTLMATSDGRPLPAHRVVAAGGALGGYGGDESLKASLLRAEGITVVGRRIRGFTAIRWSH